MLNLLKKIVRYFVNKKFEKLIAEANRLHDLTGYKYFIVQNGRKLQLFKKTELKQAVKQKFFKKGVSIQTIEKNALYITK